MILGIVNPAAAGGRTGRRWPRLRPALEAHLGPVEWHLSTGPGDARVRCAELATTVTRVYALGGDGTLSEVVDGLAAGGAAPTVELGVVPAGTGGDFRRSLDLPNDPVQAASVLARATPAPLDLIRAEFEGRTRWLLNVASTGINPHVDVRVNRSRKRLGGRLSFFLATVAAELSYRPITVKLSLDGGPPAEHTVATIAVCNGRYAGGGMVFGPDANPHDGLLQVMTIAPRSLPAGLRLLRALYRGEQARLPGVTLHTARTVQITPHSGIALLDIDGEVPGAAPATFTVEPARLCVLR